MTAETSRNMSTSTQTMLKEKKVDDAAIAEDLHSDIPDVSSKDVKMPISSNMDTEIMRNITSDLITTTNISLSTTVVGDETFQPTISLGEQTPDISSATTESCTHTDMVDEVEDRTQTEFKSMVDCNSQTDRVIVASNEVQTNFMEMEESGFQMDIKTTVNCKVQTEMKNTAECEVQTELNSKNIHCVDKLEIYGELSNTN